MKAETQNTKITAEAAVAEISRFAGAHLRDYAKSRMSRGSAEDVAMAKIALTLEGIIRERGIINAAGNFDIVDESQARAARARRNVKRTRKAS